MITATFDPGELAEPWAQALSRLQDSNVVQRIWSRDHTVIQPDPDEVANRMGWLSVIADSRRSWPQWSLTADEIVEGSNHIAGPAQIDHVVIVGMGGSSLFPEVLATTFDPGDGFPELLVLDSTDPVAVRRIADRCDLARTFIVASSKSGTTVETRSHLAYFWHRHPLGPDFAVVTDPDSALEKLAQQDGYRYVAAGDPDIGGRFSALSAFGMFPAALMGLDGRVLLDTADEAAAVLGPDTPVEHHLACQLGALMAVAAQHGRDKLTFIIDPRFESLGSWLEQLVAESTGKHGRGILPVVGETADSPDSEHRLYVIIGDADQIAGGSAGSALPGPSVNLLVEEPEDMGAQLFLWEFATTIAGIVLGINPFDQPDVESAKNEARSLLDNPDERPAETSVDDALAMLRPGDALAMGAFVDPALEPQLQAARAVLSRRAGVATTLGIGPRFLHSTGQMHKGGPDRIVMMQMVSDDPDDLEIPGESFTFGELKHAQADGDLAALHSAGKRAVRVPLAEVLALK